MATGKEQETLRTELSRASLPMSLVLPTPPSAEGRRLVLLTCHRCHGRQLLLSFLCMTEHFHLFGWCLEDLK